MCVCAREVRVSFLVTIIPGGQQGEGLRCARDRSSPPESQWVLSSSPPMRSRFSLPLKHARDISPRQKNPGRGRRWLKGNGGVGEKGEGQEGLKSWKPAEFLEETLSGSDRFEMGFHLLEGIKTNMDKSSKFNRHHGLSVENNVKKNPL